MPAYFKNSVIESNPALLNARAQMEALLNAHGVHGWSVRAYNSRNSIAHANHSKKIVGLSVQLIPEMDEKSLMNTLTHELAHILVGPSHGHDIVWQSKHISLGGTGTVADHVEVDKSTFYLWKGTCPSGHVTYRNRLTKDARERSCSRCANHWDARYIFKWERQR